MRLIGNIIYFIFGGFVQALGWYFFGLLLCITIIGIPFGKQCFKWGKLSFAPFGKKVELDYTAHPIVNTVWLVFAGIPMFISGLTSAISLCITIIFIPFGLQAFKFAILSLAPFGAKVK